MGGAVVSGFPVRWTEPHFKKRDGGPKVKRAITRKASKAKEDATMAAARKRDVYCRFPLCGCGKLRLVLDVSHQVHRGMGGNPAGDRTTLATLVLVCRARHRQNHYSIDMGTLRWHALTPAGAAGPIAWEALNPVTNRWQKIARETARHVFEPFTRKQEKFLRTLREMTQ